MIQTEMDLAQLKTRIPHLKSVDEQGWTLLWGELPAPHFEVTLTGTNALAVESLDSALSKAYVKALEQFSK